MKPWTPELGSARLEAPTAEGVEPYRPPPRPVGLFRLLAETDRTSMEIRAELYRYAHEHGLVFDLVLQRYAFERFLHRMETGRVGQRTLRGAWAVEVRLGVQHRRWKTIQLLDRMPQDLMDVNKRAHWLVTAAKKSRIEDALRIDLGSVRWISPADHSAAWVRCKLFAYLQRAQLPLQVDIRYGTDVYPKPKEMEIPSLLDLPGTKMPVYSFDALAAEKLVTILQRGVRSFRARDYYDLWLMTQVDPLDRLGKALDCALGEEFTSRPCEVPAALTDRFSASNHGRHHWEVFLDRGGPIEKPSFSDVVAVIRERVMDVLATELT